MHADEVAEEAHTTAFAADAQVFLNRAEGRTEWRWARKQMGEHVFVELKGTLDWDGHFFAIAAADGTDLSKPDEVYDAFRGWAFEVYMEIMSFWTLIHADVQRRIILTGEAGVLALPLSGHATILVCSPDHLRSLAMPISRVYPVLFTEAARSHVYSTLEQQRDFGRDLITFRERVLEASVSGLEAISVDANSRVQFGRTVRTRLEVAAQTLTNRLDHHAESVRGQEDEIADIILVSQHMQTTWANQGSNFDWVVEHARLRVGISERASTRTVAAAVFSLGVVALLRDFFDFLIAQDMIQRSPRGILVPIVGSLFIIGLSFVFYLIIKWLFMRE